MQKKEKTIPWGTLVGIRPVKRVVSMLNEGYTDDQVIKTLKKEYEVSDKKTNLAISIAKTELSVISDIPENAVSLYIDIPFCQWYNNSTNIVR